MGRLCLCYMQGGENFLVRSLSETYPDTGELVFYVTVVLSCAFQTFSCSGL